MTFALSAARQTWTRVLEESASFACAFFAAPFQNGKALRAFRLLAASSALALIFATTVMTEMVVYRTASSPLPSKPRLYPTAPAHLAPRNFVGRPVPAPPIPAGRTFWQVALEHTCKA